MLGMRQIEMQYLMEGQFARMMICFVEIVLENLNLHAVVARNGNVNSADKIPNQKYISGDGMRTILESKKTGMDVEDQPNIITLMSKLVLSAEGESVRTMNAKLSATNAIAELAWAVNTEMI